MRVQEIIGKKITSVKLAKDRLAILLCFEDGASIKGKVEGDCCSQSWIEHVEMPTELPATVLEVDDIDMPDLGTPEDYECLRYYGYRIRTDKGDIVIDYRNSSNGYYGGSISFGDQYHYGGVFGQNDSKEEWEDLEGLGI